MNKFELLSLVTGIPNPVLSIEKSAHFSKRIFKENVLGIGTSGASSLVLCTPF